MDMKRKVDFLERWKKYFGGEELPVTFWYTDDEGVADKAEPSKDHRCFLVDLTKIRQGKSLRFDLATVGCSGGKRYLGFTKDVMPNFEHFLSCGIPGTLEGGRYKKSPELVKESERRSPPFTAPARHIVSKRWDKLCEAPRGFPRIVVVLVWEPGQLTGTSAYPLF